jgi:hypothetical protein
MPRRSKDSKSPFGKQSGDLSADTGGDARYQSDVALIYFHVSFA